MNKIMITAALAVMVAGLSSCSQNEEPKYHDATSESFTINTPGLQNQYLLTNDDMTSAETFNLFCSQPDYGYAAICNYAAYVSLDPEVPTDTVSLSKNKSILLENLNPTSAAMTFKTFALATAANKMAGIIDPEQYEGSDFDKGAVKLYFRAVCEIPNVEGSRVVSKNVVSYNNVKVVYAVLKPGWIYICGDVATTDGSVRLASGGDWVAPNAANAATYENFKLMEPDELAGEKLYVGKFNLTPKDDTSDPSNPDCCGQFRFFTELLGWSATASLGSHKDDFYCLPITDMVQGGAFYQGDIISQGLGNWGIYCTEDTPFTVVVDLTNLQIYVTEGLHEVTWTGRVPNFQ